MKKENICIIKCEICGYISSRLGSHVAQYHKMRPKEYYDKYLKKEDEEICEVCGKNSTFCGIRYGYTRTCGIPRCVSILGTRKTGWSEQTSARMKKIWQNKDFRHNIIVKITESIKKKWDSDIDYRIKQSRATKRKWKNEEYRKKIRESQSASASKRIARIGNSHSDRNYKTGKFYSNKSKKNIYYASSYERKAFEKLENDENILWYDRAKVTIKYVRPDDYRFHRYVPDIFVEMKDGTKMIIEIKPESMLNDDIIKSKILAAQQYCNIRKYKYVVWTERELS